MEYGSTTFFFQILILQLALRHFSYDSEVTLASLLSRENLPLELLRLENVELRAGIGSGEWPPLDFTASDEIEKLARADKRAKDEETRKNNETKSASVSYFLIHHFYNIYIYRTSSLSPQSSRIGHHLHQSISKLNFEHMPKPIGLQFLRSFRKSEQMLLDPHRLLKKLLLMLRILFLLRLRKSIRH